LVPPRQHALPLARLDRRGGDALLPDRRGRADRRAQRAPGTDRDLRALLARGVAGRGQLADEANIMALEMTTSPPQTTPQEPGAPAPLQERSALGLVGKTLGWIAMIAAGLIVLGLLAITIGPRLLPYQALIVRSGSMPPTIPTGSVVFYTKIDSAKVKVGDVIVFAKPGSPNE